MAHNSDFSPSSTRRRRNTTPMESQNPSTSLSMSMSSSYNFSRGRKPTPTSPFASDDDRSWQGELSWQFEPTGWRDNRNLSAALSPWTATDASFTSAANGGGGSRIFGRSANDYYLSRTNNAVFHSFINHSFSGHNQPSGRLELQSYISTNHVSREQKAKPCKSPRLSTIKEGASAGKSGPLAVKDELRSTDYDRIEDLSK